MKYDVIVIGAGLSGLTAAISLAEKGKRVCVVSAGQNTLHFGSGTFDLLGYDHQGNEITQPLQAVEQLQATHPYRKIGKEALTQLCQKAQDLLTNANIKVKGNALQNHYRVTPMGQLKPTWLSLTDLATLSQHQSKEWRKPLIVNVEGYMDLPVNFLGQQLAENETIVCRRVNITTPVLQEARKSPTEMRAVNLAKRLQNKEACEQLAAAVNAVVGEADVVLMPAIMGLKDHQWAETLKEKVSVPVYFIPTMPPSVPGIRISEMMKRRLQQLGGTILPGDIASNGCFESNRLNYIHTENLGDEKLYANHFVLATGSFMSRGLKANYNEVYEAVFRLDVEAPQNRQEWHLENIFDDQPYMHFGVKTDPNFCTYKDGKVVENLFAVGSILSGHNHVQQADYAGVAMLTALQVADNIMK